ncbi:MAG: AAA family ATPase [Candidatus Acidiferrum sp.]|jgi:type II secretory pathway predicted ATPase ExeA/HSP20 family molecular chaperone IbpA
MFLDFYGLREQPFGVTPDPNYLYLSRTHGEALGALLDGVTADRGFMALIAEPGMGKTTILYRLLEELRDSARTVFLFQTQCDSREFFRYILSELGIKTARMGLVSMHNKLNEILFSEMLAGRRFVLVVDEAQDLEGPVLETIRLLSDFETPHAKLMGIILSGQPLLAEKLAQPALSQLKQRVAIVRRLEPLSAGETAGYIEHRLKVAGFSGGQLFEPEALALIGEQSQGIPREINNLCFNALSLGEARRNPTISGEIAQEVIASVTVDSIVRQLHIEVSPAPATPVRAPILNNSGDLIFNLAVEIKNAIERRAYELFEAGGFAHGHDREDWLRAESEILSNVPVEIMEGETELAVHANVPGFGVGDLKVEVAPRCLCILGKHEEASEESQVQAVPSQRRCKRIFRLVDLPSEIDPDGMKTTLRDGLLEITLRKAGAREKEREIARAATA